MDDVDDMDEVDGINSVHFVHPVHCVHWLFRYVLRHRLKGKPSCDFGGRHGSPALDKFPFLFKPGSQLSDFAERAQRRALFNERIRQDPGIAQPHVGKTATPHSRVHVLYPHQVAIL